MRMILKKEAKKKKGELEACDLVGGLLSSHKAGSLLIICITKVGLILVVGRSSVAFFQETIVKCMGIKTR